MQISSIANGLSLNQRPHGFIHIEQARTYPRPEHHGVFELRTNRRNALFYYSLAGMSDSSESYTVCICSDEKHRCVLALATVHFIGHALRNDETCMHRDDGTLTVRELLVPAFHVMCIFSFREFIRPRKNGKPATTWTAGLDKTILEPLKRATGMKLKPLVRIFDTLHG